MPLSFQVATVELAVCLHTPRVDFAMMMTMMRSMRDLVDYLQLREMELSANGIRESTEGIEHT